MSVIMFANPDDEPSPRNRCEFKAGRLIPASTSRLKRVKLVPQKERGLVSIERQPDRTLRFCWTNRETNKKELEMVIAPGDATFVLLKECKDGRACMLKFKNNSTRHFFWLQDASNERDTEIVQHMKRLLKAPSTKPKFVAKFFF